MVHVANIKSFKFAILTLYIYCRTAIWNSAVI